MSKELRVTGRCKRERESCETLSGGANREKGVCGVGGKAAEIVEYRGAAGFSMVLAMSRALAAFHQHEEEHVFIAAPISTDSVRAGSQEG